MYYANTYRKAPKKKTAVSVVTMEGETLEGYLFVTGPQRITDLLNGASDFIPFETQDASIFILNRTSISRVIPHEVTEEEDGEDDQAMVA